MYTHFITFFKGHLILFTLFKTAVINWHAILYFKCLHTIRMEWQKNRNTVREEEAEAENKRNNETFIGFHDSMLNGSIRQ